MLPGRGGGQDALVQCYQGEGVYIFVTNDGGVDQGGGRAVLPMTCVVAETRCRAVCAGACWRVGAQRVLLYEIRGLFTDVNDRRARRRD